MESKNTFTLKFLLLSLFITHIQSISIVLQKLEPYCFEVQADKKNDIRLSYVSSGINEDQIEFKVMQFAHSIGKL